MKSNNQKMKEDVFCVVESVSEQPSYSQDDFIKFYEKQKKNGDWTFYDERQFMENLFCTRLNYFFIIFSLILMAAVTVRSNTNLILVLFIGLIIQLLLWFSVNRIYVKLDIVLKILHNLDEHHVFSITDKCLKKRRHYSFSVVSLLGTWLPLLCVIIWFTGLCLAVLGYISSN